MWRIYKRVRRWWLVRVRGKAGEYVDVLDFFDNPRAPWNK